MTDSLRKAAEVALKDWLANDEVVIKYKIKLQTEWISSASNGFVAGYEIALRQALAQPEPTVEDNSQQWKGMDGAVAWHLIDRHADNWADVGKMMDEWLKANQTLAQPQEWKHCRHCGFQYRPPKEDKWHPLAQPEHKDWCDSLTQMLTCYPPKPAPCNCKPKREWVGLTDKQIYEHEWWDEETAFAVNKELMEKNN